MVGICIPTYEHSNLVERLLKSIEIQCYKDYKIYVSDDSRTNKVEELIKKYSNLRIDYIRNKKPLGTSDNVNKAISRAINDKVDIIKIMFQDDSFSNEYALEKIVHYMIELKTDVLFTANYEQYIDKLTVHICDSDKINKIKNDPGYLFIGNYLGAPSVLAYKCCELMFDSRFTWLLDVDFYLRLLPGKRMEYLPEPLVVIGHDGDQLSDYYESHPMKMIKETRAQFIKYPWLQTKENKKYLMKYVLENSVKAIKLYIKSLL